MKRIVTRSCEAVVYHGLWSQTQGLCLRKTDADNAAMGAGRTYSMWQKDLVAEPIFPVTSSALMLMRMKGMSVSQVTSHYDRANKKQAGDARHPRACSYQQGCVELQLSKSNGASPCACGAESSRMAMQALVVTTYDAMDLTFLAVGSFFKMEGQDPEIQTAQEWSWHTFSGPQIELSALFHRIL